MVKVLYGAMITELKGSMGGTTFQSSRYGFSARSKPLAPKTRSTTQSIFRSFWATVSQHWQTLSQAERDAWEAETVNWPHTDKFGNPVQLTGFNLFQMVSQNLLTAGSSINNTASSPAVMSNITVATLTIDISLGTMVLAFTPTPVAANQVLAVYASPAVSPGRGYSKSLLKGLVVLPTATASGVDLTSYFTKVYGAFPAEGRKVWCDLQGIHTGNGTVTPRFTISTIVVP